MNVTIRTKPGVTLEWVTERFRTEGLRIVKVQQFDHPNDRIFELRVKGPARQFEIARDDLASAPEVLNAFFD